MLYTGVDRSESPMWTTSTWIQRARHRHPYAHWASRVCCHRLRAALGVNPMARSWTDGGLIDWGG
jgi:hypothetical protein